MENESQEMSRAERMKILNEQAEARAREYEERKRQLEICKRCWMATYTGNGWYCPLPYCGR